MLDCGTPKCLLSMAITSVLALFLSGSAFTDILYVPSSNFSIDWACCLVFTFAQIIIYPKRSLSNSYTKNTGHTIALRKPNTPIQNVVAVDMKYMAAPMKPNPYTASPPPLQ